MAQTKVGYHIESTYDDKGVRAFKESVNGASKAGRGLATQTAQTSDRMARLGRESRYANSNMRMLRGGVGQLGHQVQDIAVQLQMGQNALLVFGQQGGQIASIFGPGGAVLGAIIGVGAALGTAFMPKLFAAKQTLEELNDAAIEAAGGVDELTQAQRDRAIFSYTQQLRELNVVLDDARKAEADAFEEMQRLNGEMAELEGSGQLSSGDTIEKLAAQESYNQASANISAITASFTDLALASDIAESGVEKVESILADLEGASGAAAKIFGSTEVSDESWVDFWESRRDRISEFQEDELVDAKDHAQKFYEIQEKRVSDLAKLRDEEDRLREQSLNAQRTAFSSAASAMSSNAQIMQESFAETSGAAKAFFALQQAVAAATVIMNAHVTASALEKAGAEAGGIPGWLTGKAMQGVVLASGYAAAGAIAGQTVASFDGGGFTGNGPRSGGVDGKGGFPAILHPNETVVDHTRGGGAGATVHLNIYANDTKGFDDLIESRRAHITNMVRRAIESEGRRL